MNLLKLNDDKTEFILTGTCQLLDKVSDAKIHIGKNLIYLVKAVHYLGTLAPTIKKVCKVKESLIKEAAQVQLLVLCQ